MAYGLKCYCCGLNVTSDTHYYCYDCTKKLKKMFCTNIADFDGECYEILENPSHINHCISCGEFENRRIIDEIYICDKCIDEELRAYEEGK